MMIPVILFAYNRPGHLRQTVTSLAANPEAPATDLIIFSDGPRNSENIPAVEAVRKYILSIRGFKSVRCIPSPVNKGLADSVISGVTQILQEEEKVIVLEDDMICSTVFLRYMNEALERFANSPEIASIHAYAYPGITSPGEYFLRRGGDCWGWGTWREKWNLFEPDAGKLLKQLKGKNLEQEFSGNGKLPFLHHLKLQSQGKCDSWAIRWHASLFLAEQYTLHPARSLIRNIGLDSSGTHCGNEGYFAASLSNTPVTFSAPPVKETPEIAAAFAAFFVQVRTSLMQRVKNKVKHLLEKILPGTFIEAFSSRRTAAGCAAMFSGNYPSFQAAAALPGGYDAENIMEKAAAAQQQVMEGTAAFERDAVIFHRYELNHPLLAGLLAAVPPGGGDLHVVDFDGAFGSVYYQNLPVLKQLPGIKWHIVEQEIFVEKGKKCFSSDTVMFHNDMAEVFRDFPVRAVIFSSVLQYLEDPFRVLEETTAAGPEVIIIDRTLIRKENSSSRYMVQTVAPEIYTASYPVRIFGKNELADHLAAEYDMLDAFDSYDLLLHLKNPAETVQFCGQIWRKAKEQHHD